MIFDRENTFLNDVNATALPAQSDVVTNGEGGVAYEQLFLIVGLENGAAGETGTFTLQGSDDEAFTAPITLVSGGFGTGATYGERMPMNAGTKYWRIVPTGTFTKGKVFAGLTLDRDVPTGVFNNG